MVMSGVKTNENNIVYKLGFSTSTGYKINEIQTYGMDVSTITENVLEQTPRNKKTDNELKELFDFIDCNKTSEAWQLLKSMRKHYNNSLPELAEAEAMLNFTIKD